MMLYIVFFAYCGIIIKEASTQNLVALAGGLYPKPDSNHLMHHWHSDSAMAQSRTDKVPRAQVQEPNDLKACSEVPSWNDPFCHVIALFLCGFMLL